MDKPIISVVIPVYNRSEELRLTLRSLTAQTLPAEDFEVIIADDGSAEDIQAVIAEFPTLRIVYRRQPDEGFRVAAARNLGVDGSCGQIIVYNDNGILFKSDNLEKHIKHHEEHGESLVVLGYMHGTSYDSDQDKMRGFLDANNADDAIALMKSEGDMGDGREGYIRRFGESVNSWYIPWLALWGGHFSVNAGFVNKHNIKWDEGFSSWGGEDNEYGIQLCAAGGKTVLFRDVEVVHYPTPNKENLDVGSERFRENYRKTKEYILSKHPTREVECWNELGSSSCDKERRAELFRAKGWEL